MLKVRTQVAAVFDQSLANPETVLQLEHIPERHCGRGQLRLLGIQNVCFEVSYDLTWVRSVGVIAGTSRIRHQGRVDSIVWEQGRLLPDGMY